MKKGSPTIGVRSASLHARIKAYVDSLNDENVTISTVVRDAIKEKLDRLEANAPPGAQRSQVGHTARKTA